MLPLVINHDGTARKVKLVDALLYLGVDISRPCHCREMTPEEKLRHRRELSRRGYRRRQLQKLREAER